MIEVIQPGLLTTVQDMGRHGFENYGMPPSGVLDPFLAAVANKLVGNTPETPLLEFALVGPTLKFLRKSWIAIAAFSASYSVDGSPAPDFCSFSIEPDSILQFHGMKGWFGYIAISGGILSEKILQSVSTYVSGNIGKKLQRSQHIHLGEGTGKCYSIRTEALGLDRSNILGILPGLHTSHFRTTEQNKLTQNEYKVSLQSNRMGILLSGQDISAPHIRRSAPALQGTVQILPSGHPLILGPEGPTTGGYPQLAVLSRASWTTLAQVRPGEPVRFEWIGLEKARQMSQSRNSILDSKDLWK